MDNTIHLYRRRYMPDETVELKDDRILYCGLDTLVTKWNVLKPRPDIDHGMSVYHMKKGFKISKVYDASHQLVYWYCDIIETEHDIGKNTYIFHDLLIDILIYPDRHVEVADLNEFADFMERQCLPADILAKALRRTDDLLQSIYSGEFSELAEPITSRE